MLDLYSENINKTFHGIGLNSIFGDSPSLTKKEKIKINIKLHLTKNLHGKFH